MVNRMVEPTSGQVLLDGRDVMAGEPAELRRGIGYVIQSAGLFPHRTVLDNVATVPVLAGTKKGKARERARELLDVVGLDPALATRYPAQLSGGQQQRVGVARALAADPPVLLMDEPFSAVDPVVRADLQREFLRLQSELGKTIALVTHDIDEAIVLGDRIAVFREGGHLAQVGSPQELLTNPADDFVREFVGRDRGYRGLSFEDARGLPVRPLEDAGPATLLLDDAGRPTGWQGSGLGTAGPAALEGTFTETDSLRLVVDLALTSPVGIAVRVDDSGKATGLVHHHDLVDVLAERRGGRA
jgi:osmoprotectant transport system ATP-binding protein